MASEATRTLKLTGDEVRTVCEALTEEMARTCKIARDHLKDHLNASPVALADSRNWLAQLRGQIDLMDKLNPPGWATPLPRDKSGDELERKRGQAS